MAEAEFRVKMEAWRFIRRVMESDLGRSRHCYCPDNFAVGTMLETGNPPADFPEANLPTSGWWSHIQNLRDRGVRHGSDSVEVMMSLRSNEAVGMTWLGHSDWEVNYRPLFPGRVRLADPEELDFVDLFKKKKVGFRDFFRILGR